MLLLQCPNLVGVGVFAVFFSALVEGCFCWGFWEKWLHKRGFWVV
jgi:hypothetical protein